MLNIVLLKIKCFLRWAILKCGKGLAIDADGAPNAYHPLDIGTDDLKNAGEPDHWWGIATNQNGKPFIQKAGDPYPGFYVSTTALQDKTKAINDPRRYVDSNTIPYIVLPARPKKHQGGAKLGDFCVVVYRVKNKYRVAYAIFADLGPENKLGEGSIALAKALGIPSDPRLGGIEQGVLYLVFPDSGNGKPRTIQEINTITKRLFKNWDGLKQLKACFP